MKNKKYEKSKNFILGIIVGILLVILISSFVIPHFQKPHFKIYKEVCRNETLYTKIGQVDTSLIVLGLEEIPIIPDNAEFSCPTNSNICRIYIVENETTCSQVKVEEIDGDTVFCLGLPETNFDWCKRNMKGHYFLYKDTKRLDIRWLDENCVVYWCDLEDNCDYFKSIYNEDWNKWKCQDYFVEVKK